MNVRTVVRDCLVLSWAVPTEILPAPPAGLRYEIACRNGDGPHTLVHSLLCFHEGLGVPALPILRFSFPQFSLASAVLDGDGAPGLLFERVFVPTWVAPAAKLVAGHPVAVARLDFARPSAQLDAPCWSWQVEKGDGFEVCARLGAPAVVAGAPPFEEQLDAFRRRRRSYFRVPKGLRSIATKIPEVEAVPLAAEVRETSLLCKGLGLPAGTAWPAHCGAMLFPELPLASELCLGLELGPGGRLPEPATSRRVAALRQAAAQPPAMACMARPLNQPHSVPST